MWSRVFAVALALVVAGFENREAAARRLFGEWRSPHSPKSFALTFDRAVFIDNGVVTEGTFTVERVIGGTAQVTIDKRRFFIRETPSGIHIAKEGDNYGFEFEQHKGELPR